MPFYRYFLASCAVLISFTTQAQLEIRAAADNSIRITVKPVAYTKEFPYTPALANRQYPKPVISVSNFSKPLKKQVGRLWVEVKRSPLQVIVTNAKGQLVQHLQLLNDGRISFLLDNKPVLGMGEGGPKPAPKVNWRELPVQYDRRGIMDSMQPRWQADAYGSRNPVALLAGTSGWALFVATPWVLVDLQRKDTGYFIPWTPTANTVQDQHNQHLNMGKGIHPVDSIVPGVYDLFVFDAHDPKAFMKDLSVITGPAAMPPKWALGYMQSHRTLVDENQLIGIVDTFRNKQIPVDAVIYLGTGFAPVGWNKKQPSFEFNPDVFHREPTAFTSDMHKRNVKVILHMVPFDRDKLPTLLDSAERSRYWQNHVSLINAGIDGFWPDEGDWFNLFERINRHRLYYEGMLASKPNVRPWSLQRNGYPGIAQWGGWVWSGDTESSWKTLEAQIAVGLNYSLSIGPYWGSDIGGFYSNTELTGELYARWFQFAAFCGSFRSHGRTWHTRLPWGWGASSLGPIEDRVPPLTSELNNPAIEPIIKKYAELRYRLMPYTYSLAWEARTTGLPLMRPLWLHYPDDPKAIGVGNEFLWGRDILVAPVYKKGATIWDVYLPKGKWYCWMTDSAYTGPQTVQVKVDLETMPIFYRAGSIIPYTSDRQYTSEPLKDTTRLYIYGGADGSFNLYNDDGISQNYLNDKPSITQITWNDAKREFTIRDGKPGAFVVWLANEGLSIDVRYDGKLMVAHFPRLRNTSSR